MSSLHEVSNLIFGEKRKNIINLSSDKSTYIMVSVKNRFELFVNFVQWLTLSNSRMEFNLCLKKQYFTHQLDSYKCIVKLCF